MTWIAGTLFVRCSPISTGLQTDQWRGVYDDDRDGSCPADTTSVSSFSIVANSTANAADHTKGGKDESRNGKKMLSWGKVEPVLKDHNIKTIVILNYSSTRSEATWQWAADYLQDSRTHLYMFEIYVLFV
jgi:hypothetical protein